MKKLLITAMALSCFALSYGQKKVEKQIIGKWCNPYTYKSTGELKGFEFKKGGKCSAINIPSLDLKTWKVDNGYLIVEGFSKEDDGKVEVYKTRERQRAQQSTPSRKWNHACSGFSSPHRAQPSISGSYPARHMAFSSNTALICSGGRSRHSNAWRLFSVRDSSPGLGIPSTDSTSAISAK